MRVKRTVALGLLIGSFMFMEKTAFAEDDTFAASSDDESAEASKKDDGGGEGRSLKVGGPLLLTQYTMQAGGSIVLEPRIEKPKKGDSAGGGWFRFNPELGFFIIDNLELLFSFNLGIPFGDFNVYNVDVGFALGARYFIDFDIVAFYAGGMIGPSFVVPDNPDLNVHKYFNINIMVGILFPLNRHVGVDLGMRFNSAILMGDYPRQVPTSVITFPIGYLGIDAFFNLFED